MQSLNDFIKDNFSTKADFAAQVGIYPQQVTQWVNAGYVVENGMMYKPMRQLVEFVEE